MNVFRKDTENHGCFNNIYPPDMSKGNDSPQPADFLAPVLVPEVAEVSPVTSALLPKGKVEKTICNKT